MINMAGGVIVLLECNKFAGLGAMEEVLWLCALNSGLHQQDVLQGGESKKSCIN